MAEKMNKACSFFEKIWDTHTIEDLGDNNYLMYIDRCLVHDLSGEPLFEMMERDNRTPFSNKTVFAVADHTVSSKPNRVVESTNAAKRFVPKLKDGCKKHNITLFDLDHPNQGIVHIVGPELGISLPGMTIVCGDSHTCTHGALGALAWGVGTSQLYHAIVTQTLVVKKPKTMRLNIEGKIGLGISSMDIILYIIAKLGTGFGIGYAVEFSGSVINALEIEDRLTLCNLTVELGSEYGFISPDEKTIAYVKGLKFAPTDKDFEKFRSYCRHIATESDAEFDKEFTMNITGIKPQVSWGTTPSHTIDIDGCVPSSEMEAIPNDRKKYEEALAYMGLKGGQKLAGLKIDRVFIGSCSNGRLSNLETVAKLVKGKKVASWVEAWIVPGSQPIKGAAETLGLADIFKDAGFIWGQPGCAFCSGANGEFIPPGERCVSTTNRNFIGRQGPNARTHLVSPATAATSAIAGCIAQADVSDKEV